MKTIGKKQKCEVIADIFKRYPKGIGQKKALDIIDTLLDYSEYIEDQGIREEIKKLYSFFNFRDKKVNPKSLKGNIREWLKCAVSDDSTREVLNYINQQEKRTCSTDGKRLHIVNKRIFSKNGLYYKNYRKAKKDAFTYPDIDPVITEIAENQINSSEFNLLKKLYTKDNYIYFMHNKFLFGFNNTYLLQAISLSDSFKIKYSESSSPLIIEHEEFNAIAALMPLRQYPNDKKKIIEQLNNKELSC